MTETPYLPGERVPGSRVVAIGFFDGMHVGHRTLIERARALADEKKTEAAVLTFPLFDPGIKPGEPRLLSTEERAKIAASLGIDRLIEMPFSAVRDLSPESFVTDVLIRDLSVTAAVVGFNFRFGKNAAGTAETLVSLLATRGVPVTVLPPVMQDGAAVSSRRIRTLLEAGDAASARTLLARPYALSGVIEHGRRVGHEMKIPTVNLSLVPGTVVPRFGVYRSLAVLRGKVYDALTNVGTCPTFAERPVHAETYLFGEFGDLYGEHVTVYLLGFVRPERPFPDAEALREQIERDKIQTLTQNGDEKDRFAEKGDYHV